MKIYNTMTRKKEEFVPIDKNEVKMYSCGPTVYDYFHIGNARPFIIFDTMRRYLEYRGYKVKFVQNFTDIDDKMINRANKEGITVKELGEHFIEEYFKDAGALGIKKATVHPKATENIDAIIDIIKTLEDKGFAYNVDGNVYFATNHLKIWRQGQELTLMRKSVTLWTSLCGKSKKKVNRHGKAHGEWDVPAGISSVLPWRTSISAKR